MTMIMAILAALGAACASGLAWLAHLLRRDRHLTWHPGDPLPDIAEDAPIRTWARRP